MTFRGTADDDNHIFNMENELISVVNNGRTTSLTYDAAGIRVKTVRPGGKTSYFPFPGYEEEVNGSTITRRITYSIAGQAVALRVQIVNGSNTLYYLHTDHLGSTSLATTTGGAVVAGSTARYYPFGDWRTEPTAGLTDRGFTGHLHHNIGNAPDDIGLVYMQARWYLPGLGRFASADTIVPNPANPQSYNRYSYVLNRALNFTDPTGHREEDCINNNCQVTPAPTPTALVNFTAAGDEEWTVAEKEVIRQGAWDTAQALARAINTTRFQERRLWAATGDPYEYTSISAGEAFLAAYGGVVTFNKTGTACATGCWGERVGGAINVYTQADDGVNFDITTESDGIMVGQLWAVHELGHAFNAARVNATNGSVNPYDDLDVAFGQGGELSTYNLIRRNGMESYPWQQHDNSDETNEVFADYFLNWTYNSFNSDGARQYQWMNSQIPNWVP